jgi:hypothetical protein
MRSAFSRRQNVGITHVGLESDFRVKEGRCARISFPDTNETVTLRRVFRGDAVLKRRWIDVVEERKALVDGNAFLHFYEEFVNRFC